MTRDNVVNSIIKKFVNRSNVGVDKYGTTLENNNKDNYLKHLQEELMDASLYIEKLFQLEEEITNLVKTYPNDQELGAKIRQLIR
jgi:hypothetical protein